MALTLNNLIGFETGGLEEAVSTDNAPTVDVNQVRSGDYSLELLGVANTYNIAPFESVADAGDDQVWGFAGYFTDLTPSVGFIEFLRAAEDNFATRCWQIDIDVAGQWILKDADLNTVATIPAPVSVNTWHFIEIRWQHLDNGAFDLHVDGVSKFSEVGMDMDGGGTFDRYRWRSGSVAGPHLYVDDSYVMSGAAGVGDFLGDAEVFRYQADTASATPDVGDNLDYGSVNAFWNEVGTTPGDADEVGYEADAVLDGDIYSDDGEAGKHYRHGPHGDGNIDGTIEGGKWLHQLKRGNGGGTNHFKRYGNDGDGGARGAVSLTTAYQNFITVSEAAASVPLSTEHFSLGFGRDGGGRELYCKGMWAFILHVPSVGPDPGELESAARQLGTLQPQFLSPEIVAY